MPQSLGSYSLFKQRLMVLDMSLQTVFIVLRMICKGSWKKASERRGKVYIHNRSISLSHVSLEMLLLPSAVRVYMFPGITLCPPAEGIMATELGVYIHKERSTYAFINLENILFALSDNQIC